MAHKKCVYVCVCVCVWGGGEVRGGGEGGAKNNIAVIMHVY